MLIVLYILLAAPLSFDGLISPRLAASAIPAALACALDLAGIYFFPFLHGPFLRPPCGLLGLGERFLGPFPSRFGMSIILSIKNTRSSYAYQHILEYSF